MSNVLILNQPQVFNGLITAMFTIPATGPYSVWVSSTFLSAPPINSSLLLPLTPATPFGAGSGMGLGTGPNAGGGEGFTAGDQGLGQGNPGQGFGAGNNYQQPPFSASTAQAASANTSGLEIQVTQNGPAIYTFSAPALAQSAVQFKYQFLATLNDAITIVTSSSTSTDELLSGVTSIFSIQQGF